MIFDISENNDSAKHCIYCSECAKSFKKQGEADSRVPILCQCYTICFPDACEGYGESYMRICVYVCYDADVWSLQCAMVFAACVVSAVCHARVVFSRFSILDSYDVSFVVIVAVVHCLFF